MWPKLLPASVCVNYMALLCVRETGKASWIKLPDLFGGGQTEEGEESRLFQQCSLSLEIRVCKTGSHSSRLCPVQSEGPSLVYVILKGTERFGRLLSYFLEFYSLST